jgi:hypothetical protein
MSCLRDKEVFLTTKETTVWSIEVEIGGVSMGECISKMEIEELAFFVIPSVQRYRC